MNKKNEGVCVRERERKKTGCEEEEREGCEWDP